MGNLFDEQKNTLENLLEHYLEYLNIRFSIKTVEAYKGRVTRVILAISSSCDDIDRHGANATIKTLFENLLFDMSDYSINYRNLTISAFNDFCKFICQSKKIFCGIKYKHIKKGSSLPKTINQKKLIKKIEDLKKNRTTWIDYRNFALTYLLYGTGMRISEALYIQQTDFHRDGMLHVRNGKNAKDRIVYHPPEALNHIKQYRIRCPYETTNTLWRSYHGRVLTRNAARLAIKNAIGHSPHALRHSFATHLHANGCDIFVLSELLGHSTLTSTQIYTKIEKRELSKCVVRHHPLSKKNLKMQNKINNF